MFICKPTLLHASLSAAAGTTDCNTIAKACAGNYSLRSLGSAGAIAGTGAGRKIEAAFHRNICRTIRFTVSGHSIRIPEPAGLHVFPRLAESRDGGAPH